MTTTIDITVRRCTKGDQMPILPASELVRLAAQGVSWRWVHEDATEIAGASSGYVAYKCPNCGAAWEEEIE